MQKISKKLLNFDDYHKQKLEDPKFRKAYDDLDLEFQIINLMVQRRIHRNLTQKQLAKKLGVKQPVISQFEHGNFNPSVKFLKRLAKALDSKLEITIR